MTTPFWCLLVIAFLPYMLALLAIRYRIRQFGGWDNDNPRAEYARLEGAGWRAWAAQQNAWEALGLFTATVAVAHLAGKVRHSRPGIPRHPSVAPGIVYRQPVDPAICRCDDRFVQLHVHVCSCGNSELTGYCFRR